MSGLDIACKKRFMKKTELTYDDKEGTRILFSAGMKLADLIESNYELLAILSRLGIPLGFGEISVAEMCRHHNLSVNLFLHICRIYSSATPILSYDQLTTADLPDILSYLHASHLYYIQHTLPRRDAKMQAMIDSCDGTNRKILSSFFADYRREVDNHFEYEEQTVFPYVKSLLDRTPKEGYNILCFEDNHSDIEGKLHDLKNIIIKYLPDNCAGDLRIDVLFEIFRFEEDLLKHTLLENHVLIPLVEKLEKDGQ